MLALPAAVLLVVLSFVAWRSGWHARLWPLFAIGWTLVLAEAALSAWAALQRPPPPAEHTPSLPLTPADDLPHGTPVDLARRAADHPTLVVVGDSFTIGQGVWEPDTFARQLGARFDDVDVLVSANAGWGVPEEATMYTAAMAGHRPDVVVWVIVLNDFGFRGSLDGSDLITEVFEPPRTPSALHAVAARALWNLQTEAATEAAYRDATRPGAPGWDQGVAMLRAVAEETTARDARFVLAIFPMLHQLDAYPFQGVHDRIAHALDGTGAEIVDLAPTFAGLDAPGLWVHPSDHHPNAEAHALAAEALATALAARPWPTSGPVACDRLPAYDHVLDEARAACADPSPARLLAVATALLATGDRGDARMAMDLAAGAWHQAATLPEAERDSLRTAAFEAVMQGRRTR